MRLIRKQTTVNKNECLQFIPLVVDSLYDEISLSRHLSPSWYLRTIYIFFIVTLTVKKIDEFSKIKLSQHHRLIVKTRKETYQTGLLVLRTRKKMVIPSP